MVLVNQDVEAVGERVLAAGKLEIGHVTARG
jgi:hypothetical protein